MLKNKIKSFISKEETLLFLACFFSLLVLRFNAIFHPPYWDSLMGPFMEAIWLYENSFDYKKLVFEMSGFTTGGPRVYFFSVYPTFLAILMTIIKSKKIFLIINHLLTFAFASGVIHVLFKISKMIFDKKISLAVSALVFFHPLFLSQASMINMDMPLLLLGLWGILSFMEGRNVRAAIFLILAFYLKSSSLIFSAAVLFSFLCLDFAQSKKKSNQILMLCLFSLPFLLNYLHGEFAKAAFYRYFPIVFLAEDMLSIQHVKETLLKNFRFIPEIYSAIIFVSVGGVFYIKKQIWRAGDEDGSILVQKKILLVSWVICSSIFLFSFVIWPFIPRYTLVTFPFCTIFIIWVLRKINKKIIPYFAFIMLLLFMLNLRGGIYDLIHKRERNDGHMLERTFHYEDDLKANQILMDVLDKKYRNKTIVTSWPIVHMLVDPNFFYVDEAFDVVPFDNDVFQFKGVKGIGKVPYDNEEYVKNLVWVFSSNCYSRRWPMDPEKDKILEEITVNDRHIYIYTRKTKDIVRHLHKLVEDYLWEKRKKSQGKN